MPRPATTVPELTEIEVEHVRQAAQVVRTWWREVLGAQPDEKIGPPATTVLVAEQMLELTGRARVRCAGHHLLVTLKNETGSAGTDPV